MNKLLFYFQHIFKRKILSSKKLADKIDFGEIDLQKAIYLITHKKAEKLKSIDLADLLLDPIYGLQYKKSLHLNEISYMIRLNCAEHIKHIDLVNTYIKYEKYGTEIKVPEMIADYGISHAPSIVHPKSNGTVFAACDFRNLYMKIKNRKSSLCSATNYEIPEILFK